MKVDVHLQYETGSMPQVPESDLSPIGQVIPPKNVQLPRLDLQLLHPPPDGMELNVNLHHELGSVSTYALSRGGNSGPSDGMAAALVHARLFLWFLSPKVENSVVHWFTNLLRSSVGSYLAETPEREASWLQTSMSLPDEWDWGHPACL